MCSDKLFYSGSHFGAHISLFRLERRVDRVLTVSVSHAESGAGAEDDGPGATLEQEKGEHRTWKGMREK